MAAPISGVERECESNGDLIPRCLRDRYHDNRVVFVAGIKVVDSWARMASMWSRNADRWSSPIKPHQINLQRSLIGGNIGQSVDLDQPCWAFGRNGAKT